ncbi:MAG: phage protease [Meiothermus sp.]|nr:phage protease [Meiothermus sp.]
MKRQRLGFSTFEAQEPPSEFLIWAYGEVPFRWADGTQMTLLFTPEDAQEVIRRVRMPELPIDYEHRSQTPVDNGPVPAAGWFQLEARPDGLWAVNVRWTETAARLLRSGEYRHWSPVFWDEDGHIRQLDMIGLTNQPATVDQMPLVASALGDPMRERLIQLLGLAQEATEEQIEAALAQLQTRAGQLEQAQALLAEAGITASIGSDEAHGQAMAVAANALLAARVNELEAELATLRSQALDGEAQATIDAALSEGRIHAASRDYWLERYRQNPRAVRAHLASLRPGHAVPTAPLTQPAAPAANPLSETERAIIAQTGVSEEAYLATKRRLEEPHA